MPCRSLVVSRVVEKQSHIHVLQTRIMNKVIQSMGIGWRLLEPNIIPEHKGLLFLQQWDCYLSGISSIDSTAGCPNLLRMTATTNRIVNFELSILTPPTHSASADLRGGRSANQIIFSSLSQTNSSSLLAN